MELTIMLLILTGMILAVVMLSGVEMRSNTLLLSARSNAHKSARESNGSSVLSEEYSTWHYPSLRLNKSYVKGSTSGTFGESVTLFKRGGKRYRMRSRNTGALQIPFSYQGSIQHNAGEAVLGNAHYNMTSAEYSKQSFLRFETYTRWRNLNQFDSAFVHDFGGDFRSMNAFHAARLISESGDGNDTPATMNRNHQAGVHSAHDATTVMYRTFSRLFGIDITDLKLRDHETNKVYMPRYQ